MSKHLFFVEKTDTFAGEANYSWVRRIYVRATNESGAIRKARQHWGCDGRIRTTGKFGDLTRRDIQGCAICYFCNFVEESEIKTSLETI